MTRARTAVIWIGGIALLAATAIDTLAVVGRHVGLPLTGSLELMQAVILVSSALGLVVATAEGTHVRVRILIERLAPRARLWGDRFSDLLTLLFFVAMLIGSSWLAADLWDGHEQSELLGVPWQLLRMVANLALFASSAILAARLFRRSQ